MNAENVKKKQVKSDDNVSMVCYVSKTFAFLQIYRENQPILIGLLYKCRRWSVRFCGMQIARGGSISNPCEG